MQIFPPFTNLTWKSRTYTYLWMEEVMTKTLHLIKDHGRPLFFNNLVKSQILKEWEDSRPDVRQMDNLFSDNEKVTRENNVMLKSRFTDEETKEVVLVPTMLMEQQVLTGSPLCYILRISKVGTC
jgi:hypothetical protein